MPVQLVAELITLGVAEFQSQMREAGNVVDSVASVIDRAFKAIEASAAAGAAAFVAFTTAAINEAVKVDRIKAILAGVAGPGMGKELFAFTAEYSKRSQNSLDDLATVQDRLEAGGLNSGHFLPIIDLISNIRGGGLTAMNQFADAFVRIGSGGNYGIAMRYLRTIGIGLNDLKAQGITVTGNNQIKGEPSEILSAVERIIKQKFEGMRDTMRDTMRVAFIDMLDSWNLMLAKFGAAWFPLIRSIITPVTQFINYLSDTGKIDALGKSFADAFGALFGAAGGGNAIVSFLTYVVTSLEMLPSVMKTVASILWDVGTKVFAFIDKVITGSVNTVIDLINRVNLFTKQIAGGIAGIIGGLMGMFGPTIAAVWAGVSGAVNVVKDTMMLVLRVGEAVHLVPQGTVHKFLHPEQSAIAIPHFTGIGDMFGKTIESIRGGPLKGILDEFDTKQKRMMDDYTKYLKEPPKPLTDPRDGKQFNDLHIEGVDAEKQTAANTSKIAAHMEGFKWFALGGGDRGQVGITVAEMYGRGRAGGGMAGRMDSGRARDLLEQAVQEMINNAHSGFRRSAMGN